MLVWAPRAWRLASDPYCSCSFNVPSVFCSPSPACVPGPLLAAGQARGGGQEDVALVIAPRVDHSTRAHGLQRVPA